MIAARSMAGVAAHSSWTAAAPSTIAPDVVLGGVGDLGEDGAGEGSVTSKVAPSEASLHSPSTKSWVGKSTVVFSFLGWCQGTIATRATDRLSPALSASVTSDSG